VHKIFLSFYAIQLSCQTNYYKYYNPQTNETPSLQSLSSISIYIYTHICSSLWSTINNTHTQHVMSSSSLIHLWCHTYYTCTTHSQMSIISLYNPFSFITVCTLKNDVKCRINRMKKLASIFSSQEDTHKLSCLIILKSFLPSFTITFQTD